MAHTTRPSLVARTLSLAAALGVLACHSLTATPSLAATLPCTAAAAQAVAQPGMTIGPINDLNPALPAVPTGARKTLRLPRCLRRGGMSGFGSGLNVRCQS